MLLKADMLVCILRAFHASSCPLLYFIIFIGVKPGAKSTLKAKVNNKMNSKQTKKSNKSQGKVDGVSRKENGTTPKDTTASSKISIKPNEQQKTSNGGVAKQMVKKKSKKEPKSVPIGSYALKLFFKKKVLLCNDIEILKYCSVLLEVALNLNGQDNKVCYSMKHVCVKEPW